MVALFLANRAIGPLRDYDAGLYHLNAVRWAAEHAIVPGLGNLHNRLAFNQAHFLCAALLEMGPLAGKSFHFINSVLVFVLAWQALAAAWRVAFSRGDSRVSDLLLALSVVPASWLLKYAASLAPEPVVYAFGILVCERLFALLEGDGADDEERRAALLVVVLLGAVGFTVKLSFAVQGALATVVGAVLYARSGPDGRRRLRRAVAVAAVCWGAVVIPWAVRGVVLSGYPAYPCPLGGLNVEWRIPRSEAVHMSRIITGWARQPGPGWRDSRGTWKWVLPWFVQRIAGTSEGWAYVLGPFAIVAALCTFHLVSWLVDRHWFPLDWRRSLVLVPWAVGAIYWVVMAPAPHFAASTFFVMAAGVAVLTVERFRVALSTVALRIICCWGVSLSCMVALVLLAHYLFHNGLFVGPGSDKGFHPAPAPEVKARTTESGLVVYVPKNESSHQCWDAPLPCTPYFNPRLRLRKPGNLASGFAADTPLKNAN